MKKICFIAQFPPPVHGLSKAVETIYNSDQMNDFMLERVDIKNNKKILSTLIKILRSKADIFYFTISQSVGGNLRDLLILKAIGKRCCLVHLHGGYYRKLVDNDMPKIQRKINYRMIRKTSGVIVLSRSLRDIFKGMINPTRIYTVPNCVDDEYMISDEILNKRIEKDKERHLKHFLYLSNFIRSKGYPIVLEMAKIEKNRVDSGEQRKYHFDFAGKFFDKEEKEFFMNYIKDNHLEEYVSYHGVVEGERKSRLLQNCLFFILPTQYPNEGQPISILEAMGNGMIVLTTAHAGIPDVVCDGENGFVFDFSNGLASSYLKSVDLLDPVKMEMIQRNNVNSVKMNYTEDKYISNMKSCFTNALYNKRKMK